MKMPPPLIVFDLDGTLVDTAPDLIGTLNVVFDREGIAPLPFDEARAMIGGGVKALLERGLRAHGATFTPEDLDGLFKTYLKLYADAIADRSRPFPGLLPALDELKERGCTFAVCTNKLEWLSVRLLDQLQLTDRFAAVCGQDTFGKPKPDPEMFRRTVSRAGGEVSRAIMVGDSRTDVDTARAAGVPVVAVDFGYTETPVELLSPDRIISHFDELPPIAAELLQL
ncbi:MAG: phosphoglycolate phosphatase [Variibacter sp.]|jgi:phosphoglycolate phosphatase|nr:phosphoglycolate phosphatase [Variibacter sp.]